MINWEYIIIQAYRATEVDGIGVVDALVHDERRTNVSEALALRDVWESDGFTVSMAGKVVDQEGEIIFVV